MHRPSIKKSLAKQADHYYHSSGARINAVAASVGFDDDELGVDAVTGRVLCFFHTKYGPKARSCKKAKGKRCKWTTKPLKRSQGNSNGQAKAEAPGPFHHISTSISATRGATPLLHVIDETSGDIFLVDTGVEVSIVMPRPGDREAAVGAMLTAANGSGIKT